MAWIFQLNGRNRSRDLLTSELSHQAFKRTVVFSVVFELRLA